MFLVKKIFVPKGSKIVPIVFLDPEGSKRYDADECSICLDKINKFIMVVIITVGFNKSLYVIYFL